MDIELAIDAMEQSETVDHLVIFSGDGDFTTLVEALQRRGARFRWSRPCRRSRR